MLSNFFEMAHRQATQLLTKIVDGDLPAAQKLMPLVYDELRRIAGNYFRRERQGHTLQPTALVNEAYLRLIHEHDVDFQGRTHFLAIAAKEMRRLLVDHARQRGAAKRGGSWSRVHLDEAVLLTGDAELDILSLEEALQELSKVDERASQVVEHRFFGGLTIDEVALVLGVSPRTVRDDWHMARAWLTHQLSKGG